MVENWKKSYEKNVLIYDSFSKFEDYENKLFNKLLENFSFEGKTVLEIGCGSGKYSKILSKLSKKYFGLEISKSLILLAKQKCSNQKNTIFFNCSAENIPLENNSVDVIFASWVLTAMYSKKIREKSLKEMLRVLKKGGNIWLFENHWEGDFVILREGKNIGFEDSDVFPLIKKNNFKIFEIVDTYFLFPNLDLAKKVIGFIFGKKGLNYLNKSKKTKIFHKTVILHRTK